MFRNAFKSARAPLRAFSTRASSRALPRPSSVLLWSSAVCVTGLSVYLSQPIALEAHKPVVPASDSVQPPTSTPPFPSTLSADGKTWSLLGCGVRRVSFLGFDVYAIGLYMPENQKRDVRELLQSTAGFQQANGDVDEFKKSLLDPVHGAAKIRWLLDQGVDIRIRIVPVRNTDFGHLRDGFVRTILAHPEAKEQTKEFADGLAELKTIFSRKMSVPKHNVLVMNRAGNSGELKITYYDAKSEGDLGEGAVLGTVHNPQVSELLLLQYLTGKKPISETLRDSVINGLVQVAIE
ncbi:Altered inheritance of mitochondria protein 18 [Yarrowia sp. B02]|nr:Altered inheritance of mitochondria protein 18 [Yarrowia sp. B02]